MRIIRIFALICLIFASIRFAPPAQAAAPTSGLVGYWNFNEVSGTTAGDSSGNGNTGALTNGPAWVSGQIGSGALSFDSVDDEVNIGSASSIDDIEIQGGISISAWIFARSYGESNVGTIISKARFGTPNWRLRLEGSNNRIRFTKDYNTADLDKSTNNGTFPTSFFNSWKHLVLTWDGGDAHSGIHIYLDGIELGSGGTNGSAAKNSDSTATLYIGSTGSGINDFDGRIDEVRIYNRALSASEVLDVYNDMGSTSSPPPASPTPPPPDTTAPVISGIFSSSITQTGATINWTTDEGADSQIDYGLTTSYNLSTMLETSLVTTHSATLTNLSAGTLYNYRVRSRDSAGNLSISSNNTFTTSAASPPPAPPSPSSAVAELIPIDRRIEWNGVGVPGGIPSRTTVCATISAAAFGNGTTDATSAIQTAINNCPIGQVVHFPTGTYKVSSRLNLTKGVVLRGDGVGSKLLIYGSDIGIRMGSASGGTAIPLSGSYGKESTQITTSQSTTISAGQFVVVDELNPSVVDNPRTYLCEDRSGNSYSAGDRCIAQIVKVVGKSGNTLTLERPLHFDYEASLTPRVYTWTMVENAGIENLKVERAENIGNSNSHMIQIFGCAYCWIKGVETYRGRGDHIQISYSYGNEIRDNFINMGHNDYGPNVGYTDFGYDSGRNYGIHIAWAPTSDNLIQNNIVNSTRHGLIIEGPGNGNVIAYNYVLNGIVYNQEEYVTGDASNHGSHPYMNLWEGNAIDGRLSFDYTHGSGSHNTIFRNHITRGPLWKTGGLWAIDLDKSQLFVNVIGNVLGSSGMSGCVYELGSSNTCGMYRLGHSSDGGTTVDDSNVKATLLRWGNFDYVSNTVKWDINERPDHTDVTHIIPASMYLGSKPSWFGSVSWPAIGPDVLGFATKIPAQLCFENQNLNSGGIFKPTECYGGTPPSPPPPPTPT
ncbi:MAG: hypothetical protein A3C85_01555, partial [Candidatus Doudnabacteria bacterium RIFCSPHIGHO2_02_FULL_48_21]